MVSKTDVLMFVEDPGAANFVVQLPDALHDRGFNVLLYGRGLAKQYFSNIGVPFTEVDEGVDAPFIINTANPKLLIVGTSENLDTLGLSLIRFGRASGIETIGVIDAFPNANRRFCGHSDNPLQYAPDWIIVPDKWTKDAYISLKYPADQIFISGHPYYDYVRKTGEQFARVGREELKKRLFPFLVSSKKIIVFAAEGPVRRKPRNDQYFSECSLPISSKRLGRTEIVMEAFLSAVHEIEGPKPFFILRLHAKDKPADYKEYLDKFDMVSEGNPYLEIIYVADLVIGITSTILIEAVLLDTPTLSIIPRPCEVDFLPTIRQGITPFVTTQEELNAEMKNLFRNKQRINRERIKDTIVHNAMKNTLEFITGRLASQL